MPFPKSEKEFVEQGYRYKSTSKCRSCGTEIEFWDTPNNKLMPLDAGTLESHFSTCPDAGRFRKKKTG